MSADILDDVTRFLAPERVWRREEVLARPSPVAAAPGVYGWWLDRLPAPMNVTGCRSWRGLTLLYTGISPKQPPRNGRPPSKSHLRERIETHYAGNAEGSTLRKTLGCLLAEELGIQLRRVGSGRRRTFIEGEQALSTWMADHASVSFVEHERPWELEDQLITTLDLPLNLDGNSRNAFHVELTRVRKQCVAAADALPVLPNPGVGGR
ncbi:GIY-YIG nuclease family protein [Geodermatophilus sp. SYSU D01180]